jgi:zinc transport system substrate-binding protein
MQRRALNYTGRLGGMLALCVLVGCSDFAPSEQPTIVVSIPPLHAIVTELIGDDVTVTRLLPPGASPHTYALRPHDAAAVDRALAVLYVADEFDGWAVAMPTRRSVAVLDLVPEAMRRTWTTGMDDGHHHRDVDPHFWTDPLAVSALVPVLAKELANLIPEHADAIHERARMFQERLTALNEETELALAGVSSQHVILHHPSWNYFMSRYALNAVGVLEASAGVEQTAKSLASLITSGREQSARAIFTEPQLARRPAEVVAEELGVPIHELDPLGGVAGRESYAAWLRYNTAVFVEALQ